MLHSVVASSPIRIRDEDKARLQQLQHALARVVGKKPSQQEVVGRAVEFALKNREAFLAEAEWKPLSRAQIKKWLQVFEKADDLGPWSTGDIDDIVYGDSH
jgi:hypothetical protein